MKGSLTFAIKRAIAMATMLQWACPSFVLATEGDHGREFNVLCGLYELAEDGAEKPNLEKNYTEVENIATEIENLFIRTTDNETEFEIFRKSHPEVSRPPPSTARTVAHAKLGRTMERIGEVKRKMADARNSLETLYEEANENLQKGLYGGEGKIKGDGHITTGFFKQATNQGDASTRGVFCGTDNQIGGAHQAFVVNFACLCTGTSGNSDLCGKGLQIAQWSDNDEGGAKAAYQAAVRKCINSGVKTSPGGIEESLKTFRDLLGRRETTNGGPYILGKVGTSLSSGECDGQANKVCVNYKYYLTQPRKGLSDIPWYKDFQTAAKKLRDAVGVEVELRRIFLSAEFYQETANQIFLEAIHPHTPYKPVPGSFSTSNQSEKQPPITPEKATAHESSSVSHAAFLRIILPWTLI